uniref:(northern house mosquito) hypothetical protein n=1 Tax=Culex pipiens TaxID=7175 RepID=A0A8D8CDH2_CULPI
MAEDAPVWIVRIDPLPLYKPPPPLRCDETFDMVRDFWRVPPAAALLGPYWASRLSRWWNRLPVVGDLMRVKPSGDGSGFGLSSLGAYLARMVSISLRRWFRSICLGSLDGVSSSSVVAAALPPGLVQMSSASKKPWVVERWSWWKLPLRRCSRLRSVASAVGLVFWRKLRAVVSLRL